MHEVTLKACCTGGSSQAVCAEDNQLGNLGVPVVCDSDQCQHSSEVPAHKQLCRLLDSEHTLP